MEKVPIWQKANLSMEEAASCFGIGIDYAAGEITVAELVDRYINLKRGLRTNTMWAYQTAIHMIK